MALRGRPRSHAFARVLQYLLVVLVLIVAFLYAYELLGTPLEDLFSLVGSLLGGF